MFSDWHLANNDQLEEFLGSIKASLATAASYAKQSQLPKDLYKPLWRIIHSSRLADAERRIDKAVSGEAHLFYKEVRTDDESTKDTIRQSMRPAGKALTLSSCLAEEVSQEQQTEAFQLCQRLLDAGDTKDAVAQELAAWKKEVLDEAG
jgi:hypothetical protein